jgi:hypothetical protein
MSAVPHHRRGLLCLVLVASALAAACTGPRLSPFQREEFQSSSTYSRSFKATTAQTCEAARRALLSQGYVVILANSELVNARKSFQTESDNHVEIEFRVVCASEGRAAGSTLAFVTALQDRYALKKSNSSASVGVGAIGSLSLPFIGSDDSMVKVASETITAAPFYDRYFRLLTQYLAADGDEPAPPTGLLKPVEGS